MGTVIILCLSTIIISCLAKSIITYLSQSTRWGNGGRVTKDTDLEKIDYNS